MHMTCSAERRFTVHQRKDTRVLGRRVPCCESKRNNAALWLQMLIKAGAIVDSADSGGRTPLYKAVSNGHQTVAEVNP